MDESTEPNRLKNLLVRRMIEGQAPPPRYVLFVDMLGFSALTSKHPNAVVWEFGSDDEILASTTSESADQLGRFQHVLNTIPADTIDGLAPSHLMLFSDCAFLVYENALQAALASTALMRRFFFMGVPVRMGLAFGTWHAQRFSYDSFGDLTITRAVFYGTGVVRSYETEKRGGKGFRIFVHSSLTKLDLEKIESRLSVLPIPDAKAIASHELKYLNMDDGLNITAEAKDSLFSQQMKEMHNRLEQPVEPDVELQYSETWSALNRMRKQLGRTQVT